MGVVKGGYFTSPLDLATCEIDGHDKNSIEVKLGFNQSRDYNVDLYLFAPQVMGLGQVNPKTEFYGQLKSYIRLQTSMRHFDMAHQMTIGCVVNDVDTALQLLKEPLVSRHEVVNGIKSIALAYEAFTKDRTKTLRAMKRSFGALRFALECIGETRGLVEQQGRLAEYFINYKGDLSEDVKSALSHACEYLSFVIVNFVSTIEEAVERSFVDDLRDRLKLRLKDITLRELVIRKDLGIVTNLANPQHLEEQFYKIRLLKKYFQKSLFVNVEAKRLAPKILQPVAGLAAGIAAVWAGFFQIAQTDQNFIVRTGLTPVGIIAIGVFAYVIKDRMKETLKARLAGKVENVLPDVERKLYYQVPDTKPQPLGLIRESIRKLKAQDLPGDIKDVRYKGEFSGLEQELGEDIIHYQKKIRLIKSASSKDSLGLREILRLNLSPYFQKLDDPFKEISFVKDDGDIARSEVHRLYYAHLAVKVSTNDRKDSHSQVYLTRLALDRKGIVRLSTFN